MSYYEHHVFVCTNTRNNPQRKSCNDGECGAHALDYLKKRAHALGLTKTGAIRINSSGCLNRCEEGPALVIYPAGRWYTYANDEDLQEILEEDLQNGRPVSRLLLSDAYPR